MIKEINVPYGKSFVYDGGTLVKGDTKAYFLTVTLPTAAEDSYTALAVNQLNGNYTDDSTVSADGHTVSVRLLNSMYNTEGLAIIRLVIMDGDKTVTVKEVRFEVLPENNTGTIASDEPNILNTLTDIKTRLDGFKLNFITSADSAVRGGIYQINADEKRNILLVSYADDEATMTEGVYQVLIDESSGSVKQRRGHAVSGNFEWTDWENIGGIENLSDGSGTGALQQLLDGGNTLDFTGKNGALDSSNIKNYFGSDADISKLPKGGTGNYATSLGGKSIAKGKRSVAQGTTTIAAGAYSHAEGDNSVALGDDSHAEGYATSAEGAASHSEGGDTHARGPHSHTEGGGTLTGDTADYSHAEGLKSEARGNYSHAEGHSTIAEGSAAHSEGQETYAKGDSAHSEGYKTIALGNFAHSEGGNTIARAESSHTEGAATEATSVRSHAEGSDTKTGALVDLTVTPSEPDIPSGGGSSSGGSGSGSSGGTTEVTITKGASHSEGYRTSAYGWGSHSEGGSTVAYHHYTHAEGTRSNAYGEGSHAEGECTETGDKTDLTKGLAAHSEGSYSKATGKYAHAEGRETVASGEGAHAEGKQTAASGLYAHAQGKNTTASGDYSFAIGDNCTASGASSFAGGNGARAIGESSFAFGENSYAGAAKSVALAGGVTSASKKFAVGDYLWVDSIDNLHTKGEVNKLCSIDKNKEGWYKFATLNFREYTGGSMLLSIKQSYVGEKYNVLIELAVTTIDNGFHEEDGFIFRQIAGKNICDRVGYVIDSTNNISLVIKKGTYEKISMVALSNNFENNLSFYNNESVFTPPMTGYLDDSLLPPTKAEIQAMISSAVTKTLNTEV